MGALSQGSGYVSEEPVEEIAVGSEILGSVIQLEHDRGPVSRFFDEERASDFRAAPQRFRKISEYVVGQMRAGAHRRPDVSFRFSTARNASCGTSTAPTCFMRFLPAFCFSSSLRLRVMSPP